MVHFLELLMNMKKFCTLKTEYEALREPIVKELVNNPIVKNYLNLACERAMEDPTVRDELVKRTKEIDPQSTEYLMLPEAVKNLLKD